MKVLKKIKNWLSDLWQDIKHYCWYIPRNIYYDFYWFFSNCRRFRKQLWNYRTWDSVYNFELLADSFDWLAKDIENGLEERISANKKIEVLHELSDLLREIGSDTDFGMIDDDNYPEYDDEYHKEFKRRRNAVLDRIAYLIKGQDENVFDGTSNYDEWVKRYDGSGFEGWWE